MHYLGKHSATKTRSAVKVRLAGVGIAGAAVLGAGVANAASASASNSGSVWDSVASCESGNNWGISTGNGFSGGLQFTQSTWNAYGGGAYASSASHASRAQQISVAQRVLAGQGAGAWPVCGRKAGLTSGNGGASSYSAPASSTVTKQANKPAAAPMVAAKAAPKAPMTVSSSTKGMTVKSSAPKSGMKMAPKAPMAPKGMMASGKMVKVHAGDTLGKLAMKYDVKGGWKALWAANRGTVHNPNWIFIGQMLHLPA